MTKAAIRRQERERQAQEEAASSVGDRTPNRDSNGFVQQPNIPRMDPPPPYDAPHLPRTSSQESRDSNHKGDSGCLNAGRGPSSGCLNYNSGALGPDFVVEGCLVYDSPEGCLNYRSDEGCLNYESKSGCLNYRSTGGCLNFESDNNDSCLTFRTTRNGCLQFN